MGNVVKVLLGEERNLGGRFDALFSFVDNNFTKFNEFTQISLLFYDMGVVLSAGSGKSSVDKME